MLTNLSKKKVVGIAWWEIEDEVKEGVLAATPRIQAFLDAYHREIESRSRSRLPINTKDDFDFF